MIAANRRSGVDLTGLACAVLLLACLAVLASSMAAPNGSRGWPHSITGNFNNRFARLRLFWTASHALPGIG
jgi:hypothetical protein